MIVLFSLEKSIAMPATLERALRKINDLPPDAQEAVAQDFLANNRAERLRGARARQLQAGKVTLTPHRNSRNG
jgi:hypothetical protein